MTSQGDGRSQLCSQPGGDGWCRKRENEWKIKTLNTRTLKTWRCAQIIQECRCAGMWVFVYPYIHVYTSKKMILANSMNSGPGYEMPRAWVSHVEQETFNSFMLHFWCHCFYSNLVPNLLFTGFSSCFNWQCIYFKECSMWSQTMSVNVNSHRIVGFWPP